MSAQPLHQKPNPRTQPKPVADPEPMAAGTQFLFNTEMNVSLTATPSVPPRPAELRPGVLVDKYLLLERVGQGGAGVVFRAEHTKLNFPVAVKFLRADVLDRDAHALARFAYEAHLMARLSHPNVVRVLDYEDDPDRPYVVMEYVDGSSATDLIARAGRLAPARAVRIVLDVADGLASAHRLKIVHRDVKPGNILVSRDGTSKLVDLGLATMFRGGGPGGPAAGALEGTLAYMPPEQANGAADTDHRSDIYSLGVTFYHLVTGQLPFTGRSVAEVIMKHLHATPPPPHEVVPGLSAELGHVVGVMLAKKREDRYPTCEALSQALATLPEARGK